MNPPVFPILNLSIAVKELLGTDPLRVYPFSDAPEGVAKPYATYSVFNGLPENYLGSQSDIDNLGTQIDIWAETAASCTECFDAIRSALETEGYLTSFAGSERDEETRLYHARMDFDFFKNR